MLTRSIRLALIALGTACVAASGAESAKVRAKIWNFDSDRPAAAAKGFTAVTGRWEIMATEDAPSKPNVLAQAARSPNRVFNVALIDGTKYRDLDLSVKLKAVSGTLDQGGGVVWRAEDAKNYYIARYNPLENNFRVYKVVRGKRTQLASANVKGDTRWHTLRVTMRGKHIACYLDGKRTMDASDETFHEAGQVGLWSKSDAQSYFDDVTVSLYGMK